MKEIEKLRDGLRLVLLFHRGGPWLPADAAEWRRITKKDEATTRVLCDHVRALLSPAPAADEAGR